ncbi:MAG: hypothetical protein KAV87_46940 [Desulfobacteraceae bacterium]|nr:hypothetical protein [Desulfobacteraceae bacterium]
MARRTTPFYGEAKILREETGKSTGETPRGRGPSNYTKIVEIKSEKAISQQGLATTCKDLLCKVKSEAVRGLWSGASARRSDEGGVTPSDVTRNVTP